MDLRAYLDGIQPPLTTSPLVDASDWLADELFWPAFLLRVGMAGSAADAFRVDLADLDSQVSTGSSTTASVPHWSTRPTKPADTSSDRVSHGPCYRRTPPTFCSRCRRSATRYRPTAR